MGSKVGVVEIDFLERGLLSDSVSYEDCEHEEDGMVLYRASFEEMEENFLKYQTAQWVLYSLLLILAWGIGLLMLLYLPIRRYILRKDFRSRKLYIAPNAIVYKVTRSVPFPCCGVLNKEKYILLPSVADVLVEQGYLQSLFGVYSVRIENAGVRKPASDDVQIQGIVNPWAFRKAVLTHLSNLRSESLARQVSTNEDQPTYGLGYSTATWARQNTGTGLTSQPLIDRVQLVSTMAAKQRSNSLPKTPAVSGVGSPASVGNMSVLLNANSPSIGTPPLADQVLEGLSKLENLTHRYRLDCKKNKVDNHPVRKPITHSAQQFALHLTNLLNMEDPKDAKTPMPMSKSLVGGSMNVCKTRVLNFMHMERVFQGNGVVTPKFRNKLVLLERPNDGTVAMQYGNSDDVNLAIIQDYGLTLPNTQYADLLAAQFCSLMMREGYQEPDDQTTSLCTASSMSDSMVTELQFPETVGGQPAAGPPSGVVTTPNCSNMSMNSSQNLLSGAWMLPPGNNQALQMSQGYLPGVAMPAWPQLDQASLQQHQQQQLQQPQIQRSLFHPNNRLCHLNMIGQNSNPQMGNHMVNKPTLQQYQMLQQAPQQQQQRKMMQAMAMSSMGNVNNNMVGLGGLGNVVGMGGVRGMGPSMSAPMGPMSGLGNMSQNQISPSQISNISNMICSGAFTASQASMIATKLRNAQNRAGMMGSQRSMIGMSGNNQMHVESAGLSMLGQTLNRANLSPLHQRTAMPPPMGPPRTQGTNFYMSQQPQPQQQQQLQFQQQQLQQQQQMQPQQQQLGSPLQHQQCIVSQPQASSPSAMAIQQQLGSPSQASLQTPMSPSSGVLQQMTAGNTGAGPASPQLSSQTLGLVNSTTSSPMDLQGVSNKGISINNNV